VKCSVVIVVPDFSRNPSRLAISTERDFPEPLPSTGGHRNALPWTASTLPRALHRAVSPDGKMLASCSWDETVRIWDVTAQLERHRLEGHGGPVYSVAFAPDGKSLASAGGDGAVRLWELVS
jgi:WD40 repeat protein